jgi:hypothetical protein
MTLSGYSMPPPLQVGQGVLSVHSLPSYTAGRYSQRMDMPMHKSGYMGYSEWLELAIFGVLAIIALTLLSQCKIWRSAPSKQVTPDPSTHAQGKLLLLPETQLVMFGLPLQLLWEIAQFPLYTVWHEGTWSYILYGLAHCTLGDLFIMLTCYWIVALLNRNRYWHQTNILVNGFLFSLLGLGYTIYSEMLNVNIKGTWAYTELMPVIPIIEIGGMPFMQWVLIPPVTLWLMRMYRPHV